MAEGGGGGGGGGETSGSRQATSYEAVGGRQRFNVELRPGETTIISWKKLLKDTAGASNSAPSSLKPNNTTTAPGTAQSGRSPEQPLAPPLPSSHPSLDARLAVAPGEVSENEAREGPPVSRLSTVIERIERLYVGKASSDEEDLNDVVPDDDEYDTEDSFIDDTELDEYFQVDNSAIKHDGFFVNRGKLERIEPTALPSQQPKKRRRKDLAKDDIGDSRFSNKKLKLGKKGGKLPLNGKNSVNPSQGVAVPSVHPENVKFQNQINASEISLKKKSADTRTTLGARPSGVSEDHPMLQEKEMVPVQDHGNKLKEGHELIDELTESIQHREKSVVQERRDTSVSDGKISVQIGKVPPIHRKEGSSGRPKSTMLDKAIRDLEKLVSESRPPSLEVQESDNNTSQAVKRRLPPEIKQKLAKVARLAQASHGKITKELLNRLMSIVGHMIQLRSLKRNLKVMVSMGLSAKQEKDNRVQQIKKEVAEMVSTRIPSMNSKAFELPAGTSDDFQETPEEREAFKRKYSMDDALEDKICYLYDLYVEALEEDAGPQVRILYAELASLWPNGLMDNHGIKRAICRAKDRRRALQSRHKDQEKIKRKKVLAPKVDENVGVEANSLAQSYHVHDKLMSGASENGLASANKSISSTTSASAATRVPVSMNGPNTDHQMKPEKIKGSCSSSSDTKATDVVPSKKVKRKHDVESIAALGDERHKSHKQVAVPHPKSNLHHTAPNFQQLS